MSILLAVAVTSGYGQSVTGSQHFVGRLWLALIACVLASRILVFCDVVHAAPPPARAIVTMASHDCAGYGVPSDKQASYQDKCVAGCAVLLATATPATLAWYEILAPDSRAIPRLTDFDGQPAYPPPRSAFFV